MNEDFARKEWADNHHVLSVGIANAVEAIGTALKRLNAIQYDAPWQKPLPKPNECNCG